MGDAEGAHSRRPVFCGPRRVPRRHSCVRITSQGKGYPLEVPLPASLRVQGVAPADREDPRTPRPVRSPVQSQPEDELG